ncbi:MAG TPA: hypothetical protein VMF05_02225 [Stellaceae bacterium]|nr:hypothetical protein [Stellaceae bacterium]
MPLSSVRAAAAILILVAVPSATALAHAVCGARVFPATLTMDDPGVNDELSLPTITYQPIPPSGGNPSGRIVDFGWEWDKTITRDLGFGINDDYLSQRGAGQNLNGWDNLSLTLKDQPPCDEADEFMFAFGVIREFARSGSSLLVNAGAIDAVSNTTPTVYFGKGAGNLSIGYFRPLAVTGELGYQISDSPPVSPSQWNYAASLQYSLPYLQQNVKALNAPAFFTHLIPLVEIAMATPTIGPTTGTIAPGVLYEATTWQAGIEALIPATGATRQLQGTGFIVQFHVFLDDVMPNSLGRPLFNTNLWQR